MTSIGKHIRLSRIFGTRNRRAVIIPMDDGLIDGAENGLRNPIKKVEEIVKGKPNALLGFKGLFKQVYTVIDNMPLIMNITASSNLCSHTKKNLVSSVEEGLIFGVSGIAAHINVSSRHEPEMLKMVGKISRQCDKLGMPLMILAYPRSEDEKGDNNYLELKQNDIDKYAQLVRHASRIGVELGADIIKTQYTGSIESFATVVEACGSVPVLIAGGPQIEVKQILKSAYESVAAGCAGVCYGRNAFNNSNTTQFIRMLNEIVHNGLTVEEVLIRYKDYK